MEEKEELISFSVDAGIINRLGKELIGRAETGVSELIKNSYDADASLVSLNFIDSNYTGGQLIIEDDGLGMTKEELIKGFMTLSSTSKVHNPISLKYNRRKAGKKGIGRFATQFLGEKLTIITQTEESDLAMKVVIEWNHYEIDIELSSVTNKIDYIPKERVCGTTLIIDSLRHAWSVAQIKRVFRYVSDLLQPDLLSKDSQDLNIASQGDDTFLVECYRTENGLKSMIVDINKVLYEKALATIEGNIGNDGIGIVRVNSSSFGIKDSEISVLSDKDVPYDDLRNVHFKLYYFIYDRPDYYKNGINRLELNSIEELSTLQSGIRVYRNGFRVLPYGEVGDDWLGLDRKRTRIEIELEDSNITFNIPYTNKNFFGFVEIVDNSGEFFEETASREGLIENSALSDLKNFLRKSVIAGVRRIAPFVYTEKTKREQQRADKKSLKEKLEGLQSKIEEFAKDKGGGDDIGDYSENGRDESEAKPDVKSLFDDIESEIGDILDELAMLRILATLGLTIGEFTHEIIQFPIFFNSKIKSLILRETDGDKINNLNQILDKVNHLDTYTTYFNLAVSRNADRELEVIDLQRVVRLFIESTSWDFDHEGILIETNGEKYGLYTVPMHPSEWHSILLNLYTNSKKALRRARPVNKRIKIILGIDEDNLFLEFLDNGDGIPPENKDLIFQPFFTTATSNSSSNNEYIVGSGLGLKIIRDIITDYKGDIFVASNNDEGYSTCIRIEIPRATNQQILRYED